MKQILASSAIVLGLAVPAVAGSAVAVHAPSAHVQTTAAAAPNVHYRD